MIDLSHVGVVVIGRNEGERLIRCLTSLKTQLSQLVYVDSGSTDESVNAARSLDVDIVALDMSVPFTAARARNQGFIRMVEIYPKADYVQFVDGDCEISANWLESAVDFLANNKNIAVVSGRLRERYPEQSIYNMLCDMEWDTPIGATKSCGGIALMRVDAFKSAGGFLPNLIAGEEPELCSRIRAAGWNIWRLDRQMALHDAAMTRFSQWWNRTVRTGYGFAEGATLYSTPQDRHYIKESRRAVVWGFVIPIIVLSQLYFFNVWGLIILLIYPVQIGRLALRGKRSVRENFFRALFLVLGKFPEAIGLLKFVYNKLIGKTVRLIEYK